MIDTNMLLVFSCGIACILLGRYLGSRTKKRNPVDLHKVHLIATAYGWSVKQIARLSDEDIDQLLELIKRDAQDISQRHRELLPRQTRSYCA